jgi:hypothetical protein
MNLFIYLLIYINFEPVFFFSVLKLENCFPLDLFLGIEVYSEEWLERLKNCFLQKKFSLSWF